MKFCPQCGTTLIPGDRFCLECGFDTSTIVPEVTEIVQLSQPAIVEEVIIPVTPKTVVAHESQKQFCLQCCALLTPGDRFCAECGYDTLLAAPEEPVANKTPVAQPANIPPPEPVKVVPVLEKAPVRPSPPPAATVRPSPSKVAPVQPVASQSKPKAKKSPFLLILVIVGVIALGAGGWFVYDKYFSGKQEPISDTTAISAIQEATPIETPVVATDSVTETTTEPVETAVAKAPVQQKAKEKVLSRVDQELAKQKAKEKNSAPPPLQKPAEPSTGISLKVSPSQPVAEKPSRVIFEVGKKDDAKNKSPKNPTKITLDVPTMIVKITTDHYNDGMGTSSAGNITVKDKYGSVVCSSRASGKPGKNGIPNAKWVVEPRKQLEKGTYFIWDSDMATWSKNLLGVGFVVVEGYDL